MDTRDGMSADAEGATCGYVVWGEVSMDDAQTLPKIAGALPSDDMSCCLGDRDRGE